jgi:hypothetical protein
MAVAKARRRKHKGTAAKAAAEPPSLSLFEIEGLAASGKLGIELSKRGIADFVDTPRTTPRRFSSLEAFDRSTFDYEAYSAALAAQLKK